MIFLFFSVFIFGNVLYSDYFGYSLFDSRACLIWSPEEMTFMLSPIENITVITGKEFAVLANILRYSRIEVSAKFSKMGTTFYIQDRKPFISFNHFTIGFDFSKKKSVFFSSILDTYGVLPDQFVNLGTSLRIYEDGSRILRLIAQIRFWRSGIIASIYYGGDRLCDVSFYFSF